MLRQRRQEIDGNTVEAVQEVVILNPIQPGESIENGLPGGFARPGSRQLVDSLRELLQDGSGVFGIPHRVFVAFDGLEQCEHIRVTVSGPSCSGTGHDVSQARRQGGGIDDRGRPFRHHLIQDLAELKHVGSRRRDDCLLASVAPVQDNTEYRESHRSESEWWNPWARLGRTQIGHDMAVVCQAEHVGRFEIAVDHPRLMQR